MLANGKEPRNPNKLVSAATVEKAKTQLSISQCGPAFNHILVVFGPRIDQNLQVLDVSKMSELEMRREAYRRAREFVSQRMMRG